MGEETLQRSRTKTALGLVGSLAFVALGAWIVGDDGAASWKGWAAIVFFGGCAVVYLLNLVRPVSVRLDATGFTVDGVFKSTFTSWEDVESFYLYKLRRTRLVAWKARPGRQRRSVLSAVNGALGAPNSLPGMMQLPTEAVLEKMSARLEASRSSSWNGPMPQVPLVEAL